MSLRSSRRRSPPGFIWVLGLILVAAIVGLVVLTQVAWQRTQEVRPCRARCNRYKRNGKK